MLRRGVLVRNEVLSAGIEIVEHVLLVRQVACQVPLLAVLSAAAQISDGVSESVIQQQPRRWVIIRPKADVVAPVSGQQNRVLAIQYKTLLANDIDRYSCAVLRNRIIAHHFGVVEGN